MRQIEVRSQKPEVRMKIAARWASSAALFGVRNPGSGIRNILLLLLCSLFPVPCTLLQAQSPATTTVQDTVYKSDGSLASGSVVITWQPFISADHKPVFGGTKTIPLTNGALSVQLAPTVGATPAGTSYDVKYYQSGAVFYEETWVVPSSAQPVGLAQVRATAVPSSNTVINPSQVVGTAIVANPPATQTISAPATAGTIPLRLKGNATANADVLEIYDSQATPQLQGRFDPTGALLLSKAPTFSSITQGSPLFAGPGGLLSQDNTNLFWDNTLKTLNVGPRTGFSADGGYYLPGAGSAFTVLNNAANQYTPLLGVIEDNSAGFIQGIQGSAVSENSTGTRAGAVGIEGDVTHNGAGDAGTIFGLAGTAQLEAGTATRVIAVGSGGVTVSGGTVTDMVGLNAASNTKTSGTVTNNYGLLINNQTIAGATNWAIKTGSGTVEFGDNVVADTTLSAKRVNSIRFADQFSGADSGAKIGAAVTDLPARGGTVVALALEGNQAGSATIHITKPVAIKLGAGTYTFSAPAFSFEAGSSGSSIEGLGIGVTNLNSTVGGKIIAVSGITGITIKNLSIDGAYPTVASSTSNDAISCSGSNQLIIENVSFANIPGVGVSATNCSNVIVNGNKFATTSLAGVRLQDSGAGSNTRVWIQHNDFQDVNHAAVGGHGGIQLYGGAATHKYVWITNNNLATCGTTCIEADGGEEVHIIGNTITGALIEGIAESCFRCEIKANSITGSGGAGIMHFALVSQTTTDVTISDNFVWNNSTNPGQEIALVWGETNAILKNLTVTGNRTWDTNAGVIGIQSYLAGGVSTYTADNVRITDNNLQGNSGGAFNLLATSDGSTYFNWGNITTDAVSPATGTGNVVLATSPTLTTPRITTINDASGHPFIASSATASAVDSFTVTNAAAANPAVVSIGATGTDTNIDIELIPKGTNGKVGIGTIPSASLEVYDNAGTGDAEKHVAIFNQHGTGAQSPALVIQSNGTTGLKFTHTNSFTKGFIDMNYSGATALAFGLRGSEKVRIDNLGNVGIGTAAPATLLDVNGAIRSTLTPIITWTPSHAYSVNDTVIDGASHKQTVTTCNGTCTSSATVPTWNDSGGTTADGSNPNNLIWTDLGLVTTWDASLGNSFKMTLTGNQTASTLANAHAGQPVSLLLCQDATGSRSMSWPANVKLAGGAFTLTVTASRCDSLTVLYDGSNWYETSRAINM